LVIKLSARPEMLRQIAARNDFFPSITSNLVLSI